MIQLLFDYSLVFFLFFAVSIVYSSIGFGGGSSYLAILALTTITFTQIRTTSLLCNLFVVSGNVLYYYRLNQLDLKKTIPIVSLSIPFAFLGGYLKINETIFFILLGTLLILASIMMWYSKKNKTDYSKNNRIKNSFIGGIIGFFSGIVGIGGGIFLAPTLHLSNWDTTKKIASTSSLFILLNSLAGLLGQFYNPNFTINWTLTLILLLTVLIGGQIGRSISQKKLTSNQIKKITSLLIGYVGIKILVGLF